MQTRHKKTPKTTEFYNRVTVENYEGVQNKPIFLTLKKSAVLTQKANVSFFDCIHLRAVITEPVARIDVLNCEYVELKLVSCITSIELVNCKYCDISWQKGVGSVTMDSCLLCSITIKDDTKDIFQLNCSRCVGVAVNDHGLKYHLPDYYLHYENGGEKYKTLSIIEIKEEYVNSVMRKKFLHPRSITFLSDISVITPLL